VFEHDYKIVPIGSDETPRQRLVEFEPAGNHPSHAVIKELYYGYSPEKTTLWLDRNGMVVKEEEVVEDKATRDTSTTVSSFNPPVPLAKPFDWRRTEYVAFEVPPYIDFPSIKVRSLKR
jgi:hypothetical protein